MTSCSFINCQIDRFTAEDDRVEVKTVLPNSGMKKMKSKLLIRWLSNGEAAFHKTCWDILLKTARARKYRSALPKMSGEEKALVKEAAKTAEFFDSLTFIKSEAARVAVMILCSKHCVAFTGAGISTSAGIGDYRGKSGKWTQQDQGALNMDALFGEDEPELGEPLVKKSRHSESAEDPPEEVDEGVAYETLRPTYTHEALQKLIEMGHIKYIISQNGDGLHTLSGVDPEKLSELHGNVFLEKCEKCGARYDRPYYVMDDASSQYFGEMADYGWSSVNKPPHAQKCDFCGLCHRTGRRCKNKTCQGYLIDTIINFCDNLEDEILDRATEHSKKCDLMLCLGSTLTVTPANSLVSRTKDPPRLVACNRQKTHIDQECTKTSPTGEQLGSRVFGDCDVFMAEVMKGILEAEELQTWQGEREKRMKVYRKKRC